MNANSFLAKPWIGKSLPAGFRDFDPEASSAGEVIESSPEASLTLSPGIAQYLVWQYGTSPDELLRRFQQVFTDLRVDEYGVVTLNGVELYKIAAFNGPFAGNLSILYLVTLSEYLMNPDLISQGYVASLGKNSRSCDGLFSYASVENVMDLTGNICLGKTIPEDIFEEWTTRQLLYTWPK